MSEIELFYKIIPIFSQFPVNINDLNPESSIDVSFNCTSEEVFNHIKEKEYRHATSLLPIGLLNTYQIINFTINETLDFSVHESASPTIYMFRKTDENSDTNDDKQIHRKTSVFHTLSHRNSNHNRIYTTNDIENDLPEFNNALKCIHYPEHFHNCLFIHLYKVTDQNISQIIALENDNNQLTLETVHNTVKNALRQDSTDKFIFLSNGHELIDEETFKENKYSFITVINRSTPVEQNEHSSVMINLQLYLILIRISIYSILFSKTNLINFERFLNYCDQNKSFSFETREFEICLLTIIQLFNQQIGNKWSHLNYYDLLIPQSKNIKLTYYHTILLFGDTLFEYIRTTQLPLLINKNDHDKTIQQTLEEFMPKFIECLNKTLSESLVINPKQTEIQTATVLCQKTLIYMLKIVFSSILIIGSIIKCSKECWKIFRKKKEIDKKVFIDLIIHFCSIILILPIFNLIIYYSLNIPSFKINQMEIYWPLLLIISILIILHVYQTTSFHRKTFLNKKILQNTFNKAHLNILEIKSTPNSTKSSKYFIKNQDRTHFYEILERNLNDFHPTLLKKSITHLLINSSNNSNSVRSTLFSYLVFPILIICFIPLVLIHPLIPTIYRIIHSNISLTNISWYIKLDYYSYIILSFIFYSLLVVLMIKSISDYLNILYNLQLLLSSTDLKKQVDFECKYYLNLRREENLEYFIHLFQRIIENIDKNHILIAAMTCTLLIDIILILTAIIRVFVYGRSTDLLTIWCLIDIVILSFFIMLFIIVVVLINKSINYDFIRHLRNSKKDMITSNIVHKEEYINYDYLDIIIEHMESVTDQYSVKLLGFVVDHSLAIKIFISIITGIASAIASLIQQ